MQDWAQIRYLHGSEGMSVRAIAARLGLSRDTVSRAVRSSSPPGYVRVSGPSAFDPFEGHVRLLLAEFPAMPATVIAERAGWPGSASWFRKKVAALRVEYVPKDPADRIAYRPGDQAQCDLWFRGAAPGPLHRPGQVPARTGNFGLRTLPSPAGPSRTGSPRMKCQSHGLAELAGRSPSRRAPACAFPLHRPRR